MTTKEIIYLDNNGTTKLCNDAIKEINKWLTTYGNPSTDSILSKKSNAMIQFTKDYILKHCKTNKTKHSVIFTSGATESNSFILRSTPAAYKRLYNKKPHVIISGVEHPSIMACAKCLCNNKLIELTTIMPEIDGSISPTKVKNAIKSNTCLISIMFANNETGVVNDIQSIGSIAKSKNIPFHTDAVQIFGKTIIDLPKNNIDAISVSFHKLYSPLGIGLLIISNDIIKNLQLEGIINGSQQGGLRGGTESVPNIAGSLKGMMYNFTNRNEKNKKLISLKTKCLSELEKILPMYTFEKYMSNISAIEHKHEIFFVLFGNIKNTLPNTILISVVSLKKKFCNILLKKYLEKKFNIILAIGSACSTSSADASHVVTNMGASQVIKRGIIRISFGDNNKLNELSKFIPAFVSGIHAQVSIISKTGGTPIKKKVKFKNPISTIYTI